MTMITTTAEDDEVKKQTNNDVNEKEEYRHIRDRIVHSMSCIFNMNNSVVQCTHVKIFSSLRLIIIHETMTILTFERLSFLFWI
jgi:hypothetical protein